MNKVELVEYFKEMIGRASLNAIAEPEFRQLSRKGVYEIQGGHVCPPYQVETPNPIDYLVLLETVENRFSFLPAGWANDSYSHEIEHFREAQEQFNEPEYELSNYFCVRFVNMLNGQKGIQPGYHYMVRVKEDKDDIIARMDAVSRKTTRQSKFDLLSRGDDSADSMADDEWR